jgi:hypothetical protein
MKKRETDIKLPEELSGSDVQDLLNQVHKYEVKYPDEAEIGRTIEVVRSNMKKQEKQGLIPDILRLALSDVSLISPFYWMTSLAIYIAGALLLLWVQTPLLILFLLSPVPFMLGMMEIFRSRDEHMLELEQSCKFNAVSVIFSRLFIIGIYSIVLNTVYSFWLSLLNETLGLFQLTIYWLTPFTVVCGITLMAASNMKGSSSAAYLLPFWGVICFSTQYDSRIQDLISAANVALYVLMLALGIAFTAYQIHRLHKNIKAYCERNAALESQY